MSQSTDTTTATEPQVNAPAALAEQVSAADVAAADQEQAARRDADKTAKAAVSAYRKGEKAYGAGLLEAGKLAHQYLLQRMALRDKRAAAVQVLEGGFAAYASSAVDVNELVACYQASRLLAEDQGIKADAVPYGHYRNAWRMLVERIDRDTPAEAWVLLSGLEEDCRTAFATAVKDGLSRDAVVDRCKLLAKHYNGACAARAKAAHPEAEAKRKAEAEAVRLAAEAVAAAQAEAARLKAAAEAAAEPADKAQLAAEAEAAEEAVRAEQQRLTTAAAVLDAATKETERAAKLATKAEDKERRTVEKAVNQANRAASSQPRGEVSGNLIAAAGKATVKDLAGMVAECILEHDAPEEVAEEVLKLLAKATDGISAKGTRAINAALLVWSREDKPGTNGTAQ